MKRDAIDFGTMKISRLFVKLFIPTFMGLLFGALLNIADGIFVGRGVNSDALAAVNIAAPVFQIFCGIGLMFGAGVSVVAAIHLSRNNVKAANINITQAFTVSILISSLIILFVFCCPEVINRIFGGSDILKPYVVDYLRYVSLGLFGSVVLFVGLFVIRLDGSPKYAMMTNVIPASLNILLDWYFVFPLQMGIKGAALATSISEFVGMFMVILYFIKFRQKVSLYRPKISSKAIRLTMRNVGYMINVGFPTFIGETALSCMMIVGNFQFMRYLHEDGVAAYSVACYLFPMVFMFGNAIAQSSLPIISYNHGLGDSERIRQTFRLSMTTAAVCGLVMTIAVMALSRNVLYLFLGDQQPPLEIGMRGLPLYAISFVFFTLNVVMIGYFQSIEKARASNIFMLIRGYLMPLPCFLILPALIGDIGLWLAIPLSEAITFIVILSSWRKISIRTAN